MRGEGALQRSGKKIALCSCALALGIGKPRAKAHCEIERFSAGLKSSFPLLKQGAPTRSGRFAASLSHCHAVIPLQNCNRSFVTAPETALYPRRRNHSDSQSYFPGPNTCSKWFSIMWNR